MIKNNNFSSNNLPLDAKVDALMEKIRAAEKGHNLDLSSDQDLSMAVMNLIAIEEHLFFTGQKTGKSSYYDLLFEVREQRKELMMMLLNNPEGEIWCTSKHLLSASMRCMEVGTKFLTKGENEQAQDFFRRSYDLFNLFWALNLNLIEAKTADKLSNNEKAELKEIEKENDVHEHRHDISNEDLNEKRQVIYETKKDNDVITEIEVNDDTEDEITEFEVNDNEIKENNLDIKNGTDLSDKGFMGRLKTAIGQVLDCCRE